MVVGWRLYRSIYFLSSCLKLRRNRWFGISNFKTTAALQVEEDKRMISINRATTGDNNQGENLSEDHNIKVASASRALNEDHSIPSPQDLNLYQYVKTLENTVAQKKGTILKSWSRLTKQPWNKNLNVCGSLKSGAPHCLGLTTQLLEHRIKFLQEIGIEGKDALIIALEFPAILSWESQNFAKILKVLTQLNCDIVRLLCRAPHVFGLDFLRVTENVNKLANSGVSSDIIGKLVTLHPVILSFPLREESLDIIKLLLYYHNNIVTSPESFKGQLDVEEAVFNLLLQPLEKSLEQVNFKDRFQGIVSFLHELQVSPLIIAAKNPFIFHTDVSTLHKAVDFFSNKPLLLEMEVIQNLLTSRSEIFVNFDEDAIRTRVQLIYGIVHSPTALYNLILDQSSFVFDKGDTNMEDLIHWFLDVGVEDKQLRDLVTLKNFFSLKKGDLDEKVKYLLSVKGVTMEAIKSHPACLLKPLTHLKQRVEFLNVEKPNALVNNDVGQIFLTKNKDFASKICELSQEEFLKSRNKDGDVAKLADE